MRSFFTSLLLLPIWVSGQSQLHDISVSEQKAALSHVHDASRFGPNTQAISNSDFVYQRCEWNVDPAIYFIDGKITTYFVPNSNIDSLEFDCSFALTIDSVIFHSAQIPFNLLFTNILQVGLSTTVNTGTLDSVSVFYHGIPNQTGFGSFDTSLHNNTPVMWTLSQPNGASDWWPCKQDLNDKIDSVDIIMTIPAQYKSASNGLLVAAYNNGPTKTEVWKHRYPIATYLIAFAVSNYAQFTVPVTFGANTLPVENFVYPEDSAAVAFPATDIVNQMLLYDTLFGIYPFAAEKYGHTECNFGGGMEHQTNTFIGGFSYELLSHELAHHWFGDKVTCASWHDIWLNEGFATYLSGLCYEHYFPNLYWPIFKQQRISYITTQPNGSVYCPDTLTVSRIFDDRLSYAKGAMILHTLRWVIGDSAWYAAVNNYLQDASCSYGFATTNDLKSHFEMSSGQNLSWYFNDWFTGEGYPSYHISWSQDAMTGMVSFSATQFQSDASVSFFELPLPIEFKDATHDTIIRVQNNFSGENFTVQLPFLADSLIFDPEMWIISANNVVNYIEPIYLEPSLNIVPNPGTDHITIYITPGLSGSGMLNMYDMRGRLVKSSTISFTGNFQQEELFIDDLAQGAYIVKIETEMGTKTGKVVKR